MAGFQVITEGRSATLIKGRNKSVIGTGDPESCEREGPSLPMPIGRERLKSADDPKGDDSRRKQRVIVFTSPGRLSVSLILELPSGIAEFYGVPTEPPRNITFAPAAIALSKSDPLPRHPLADRWAITFN